MVKVHHLILLLLILLTSCNNNIEFLTKHAIKLEDIEEFHIRNGRVKDGIYVNVVNRGDYQIYSAYNLNSKLELFKYKIFKDDHSKRLIDLYNDTLIIHNRFKSDILFVSDDFSLDTFMRFDNQIYPFHEMTLLNEKIYFSQSVYGWAIADFNKSEFLSSDTSNAFMSHDLSKFHFINDSTVLATSGKKNNAKIQLVNFNPLTSEVVWTTWFSNELSDYSKILQMNVINHNHSVYLSYGKTHVELDLFSGDILNEQTIEGLAVKLLIQDNIVFSFVQEKDVMSIYEINNTYSKKNNSFDLPFEDLSEVYYVDNNIFITNRSCLIKLTNSGFSLENKIMLDMSTYMNLGFFTDKI